MMTSLWQELFQTLSAQLCRTLNVQAHECLAVSATEDAYSCFKHLDHLMIEIAELSTKQ